MKRLTSLISASARRQMTSTELVLPVSVETKSDPYMSDIAILQAEIAEWADRIIPDRTAYSTIAKILEELGELIASKRMRDPEELADVAILLLDLFHLQGIDMKAAVRAKMQINRNRRWNVSDSGAAKHV